MESHHTPVFPNDIGKGFPLLNQSTKWLLQTYSSEVFLFTHFLFSMLSVPYLKTAEEGK